MPTSAWLLRRQLSRFLVVGSTTVLIDFLVYALLIMFIPVAVSKTVSFLTGTLFAYFANKLWTFEKKERDHVEMLSFLILYGTTLVINVGVNQLTLWILPDWIGLAFLAATGTSTILNFIGQKWWVFRITNNDNQI